MNQNKKTRKVALVIGSGGIKCSAVIGIMKVLGEHDIAIDLVVGCSGGAVFGAAIALGFSQEKITRVCSETWTTDITKKINFKALTKIIFPKIAGFDDELGIYDDRVVSGNIKKAYGASTTFNDTHIPFFCVATDFQTGESLVISEGKLAKAVSCSSRIPMVWKPVELEGRLMVDGALSNPLPIDVAIQQGADIIIAVGFESSIRSTVSTFGQYAMQMFNIMTNQLLSTLLGYYNLAHHSEIILIIPELKESIKINDVDKVPLIVEQGEKETKKHINYLKKLLSQT